MISLWSRLGKAIPRATSSSAAPPAISTRTPVRPPPTHLPNLSYTNQPPTHPTARAGKVCIAEVEELLQPGDLHPDEIHLPGIYVHRILKGSQYEKRIERVTVTKKGSKESSGGKLNPARERIVKRAAQEFKDGMYVNLGIGIPVLASNYLPEGTHPPTQPFPTTYSSSFGPPFSRLPISTTHLPHPLGVSIELQSENGLLGMGPYPEEGTQDADIINAGKETVTYLKGSSTFSSSESFGMIRGAKVHLTMLGALQVAQNGDLANWIIPRKMVKGKKTPTYHKVAHSNRLPTHPPTLPIQQAWAVPWTWWAAATAWS